MRRSLLLGLTGALVLLIIGVSGGFAGHTRAAMRERNNLASDAAEQVQVLNAYFARAASIILLTAHSSEYRRFYTEPGDRDQRVRRGGPTVDTLNESLGYLEQLYPDRIGEACFIDASGAENARTVRGERATYADLSHEEDKQPFFKPTFALTPNQVYQAKPYESPDTNDWVIANSTPVIMLGTGPSRRSAALRGHHRQLPPRGHRPQRPDRPRRRRRHRPGRDQFDAGRNRSAPRWATPPTPDSAASSAARPTRLCGCSWTGTRVPTSAPRGRRATPTTGSS